jgi:hypothetical protein
LPSRRERLQKEYGKHQAASIALHKASEKSIRFGANLSHHPTAAQYRTLQN